MNKEQLEFFRQWAINQQRQWNLMLELLSFEDLSYMEKEAFSEGYDEQAAMLADRILVNIFGLAYDDARGMDYEDIIEWASRELDDE